MRPWPIREFAGAVCGFGSPNPLLAMLVAYFDESGIHDHSKVVSVAGLLADTSEWARLEQPWREQLSRPWLPKNLWFHAYECEEGVEQFDGIQRPVREALANGLTNAILDRSMAFIGGSVFREDWERCTPQAFRNRFADPYDFCFEFAIQHVAEYVSEHFPGEFAAVVVAVPQDSRRLYVEKIHDLYQRSGAYPALGSLSFNRPQTLIQLQAADLVAFEHYQQLLLRWKYGREGMPRRPNFQKMINSSLPVQSGFHDCKSLERLVSDWPDLEAWKID